MSSIRILNFALSELISSIPKPYSSHRASFSLYSPEYYEIESHKLEKYAFHLEIVLQILLVYRHNIHKEKLLDEVNDLDIDTLMFYQDVLKLLSQDDLPRDMIGKIGIIVECCNNIAAAYRRSILKD